MYLYITLYTYLYLYIHRPFCLCTSPACIGGASPILCPLRHSSFRSSSHPAGSPYTTENSYSRSPCRGVGAYRASTQVASHPRQPSLQSGPEGGNTSLCNLIRRTAAELLMRGPECTRRGRNAGKRRGFPPLAIPSSWWRCHRHDDPLPAHLRADSILPLLSFSVAFLPLSADTLPSLLRYPLIPYTTNPLCLFQSPSVNSFRRRRETAGRG